MEFEIKGETLTLDTDKKELCTVLGMDDAMSAKIAEHFVKFAGEAMSQNKKIDEIQLLKELVEIGGNKALVHFAIFGVQQTL